MYVKVPLCIVDTSDTVKELERFVLPKS
jgi:hypothetical protein